MYRSRSTSCQPTRHRSSPRRARGAAVADQTRDYDVSDINVKSYPSTNGHLRQAPRPDTATLPDNEKAHAPLAAGDRAGARHHARARHLAPCAAHRAAPRPGRRRKRRAGRRANAAGLGGDELRDARARLAERAGDRAHRRARRRRLLVGGGVAADDRAAAVDSRGGDGGGVVRRRLQPAAATSNGGCDRRRRGRADAVAAGERAAGERALVPRPSSARPSSAHIVAAGARPRPASARLLVGAAVELLARRRRRRFGSDWSYEESAATMSELQPTRGRTAASVPPSSGGESSLRCAPSRPASARSAYQQSRVMEERRADVLAVWALPR